MGTRDLRVDAYIAQSAAFAQPILEHLREVVHGACPGVEETLKWSTPHFLYHGTLCGMAAFERHCTFGFWKGSLIMGEDGADPASAMGQFGRITSVDDLPDDEVLAAYVREAMRLNERGVAVPRPRKYRERLALAVPDFFAAALAEHEAAQAGFAGLTPGQQREYVWWVSEAKREETRQRRVQTALAWLAEGKPRDWRYLKPNTGDEARRHE